MRIRKDNNYKAVFTDSYKTIRLGDGYPTLPELEDVGINDKCYANCSYCYTNALRSGTNFTNIVDKAYEVWSNLGEHKPFQIAIGGSGEPTLHPDFIEFVKSVKDLGILPNYTTNGMLLALKFLIKLVFNMFVLISYVYSYL